MKPNSIESYFMRLNMSNLYEAVHYHAHCARGSNNTSRYIFFCNKHPSKEDVINYFTTIDLKPEDKLIIDKVAAHTITL